MLFWVKKHRLLLLTLFLVVVGYLYLLAVGDSYTIKIQDFYYASAEDEGGTQTAHITAAPRAWVYDDSVGDVEILGVKRRGNGLEIRVKSLKPGRVFIGYQLYEDLESITVLYVHSNGMITYDDYFGECTGSDIVRAVWVLYIAFLAMRFLQKYRSSIRRNRYLYANILYSGLLVFTIYILFSQILNLSRGGGAIGMLTELMGAITGFGFAAFLPMVLVSILVMISNIKLIRKEGRNWRNLLGTMLGAAMIIACITPTFMGAFLQNTKMIDVHNWRGTGRFVGMFIENFFGTIVTYLCCILIGTIIVCVGAARHIPSFDKDYILILGCMIKKDGTLTKLLQSRADRALEFDRMQQKAGGKELIFVPSGGKGEDEIISEAEAIAGYLKEKGIPEERILVENRSGNTEENLRFSSELIRRHAGGAEPKIAFSTTNYHVFRAGLLASDQGIMAEGIGSGTKSYFWINAFVREFIATIFSEKRTHLIVLGVLTLINLLMVVMTYISNVVLS